MCFSNRCTYLKLLLLQFTRNPGDLSVPIELMIVIFELLRPGNLTQNKTVAPDAVHLLVFERQARSDISPKLIQSSLPSVCTPWLIFLINYK